MEARNEKKISTLLLKQGMYVSNLDRPWLDTPFLLQGFLVRDDDEIMLLKKYCDHVYIDLDRGIDADDHTHGISKYKTNKKLERFLQDGECEFEYVNTKTASEEMPIARKAIDEASRAIFDIMEDVKSGKSLDYKYIKEIVEPILDSVIRNPEPMMWLTHMRQKEIYTHAHSIDNCAIAAAFGRHMGLPKEDLRTVAIGLLLMDVGKMRVPEAILNKNGALNDDEYRVARSHVAHSVDILSKIKGLNADIINIALTHHERYDGSGYPGGLTGLETPVYGRMAAIIDCYDAMTSKRPYGEPVSANAALQEIYNWRNKYFQDELVEQFLQCMGAFPTGSLVEMHSGEVGIVTSQNKTRRMSPKVMLVLDKNKQPLSEHKMVDLMEPANEGEEPLVIFRGLDPGSHGIDQARFYL